MCELSERLARTSQANFPWTKILPLYVGHCIPRHVQWPYVSSCHPFIWTLLTAWQAGGWLLHCTYASTRRIPAIDQVILLSAMEQCEHNCEGLEVGNKDVKIVILLSAMEQCEHNCEGLEVGNKDVKIVILLVLWNSVSTTVKDWRWVIRTWR